MTIGVFSNSNQRGNPEFSQDKYILSPLDIINDPELRLWNGQSDSTTPISDSFASLFILFQDIRSDIRTPFYIFIVKFHITIDNAKPRVSNKRAQIAMRENPGEQPWNDRWLVSTRASTRRTRSPIKPRMHFPSPRRYTRTHNHTHILPGIKAPPRVFPPPWISPGEKKEVAGDDACRAAREYFALPRRPVGCYRLAALFWRARPSEWFIHDARSPRAKIAPPAARIN